MRQRHEVEASPSLRSYPPVNLTRLKLSGSITCLHIAANEGNLRYLLTILGTCLTVSTISPSGMEAPIVSPHIISSCFITSSGYEMNKGGPMPKLQKNTFPKLTIKTDSEILTSGGQFTVSEDV